MAYLLFLLCFAPSMAFASLQKISISNLNLEYVHPQGNGTFEKLQIGIKSRSNPVYPVDIYRAENSFDLKTPFVDFSWLSPAKFVHDLSAFSTKALMVTLDKQIHTVETQELKFSPQNLGEFILDKLSIRCEGQSERERVEHRLLDDCQNNLAMKIEKILVPVNLMVPDILETSTEEIEELPGSDFLMNISKGDFDLSVKIKYYLKMRLLIWGHFSLEDNDQVAVIRLDRVKYGILPITQIVFNELKKRVSHPDIEITPPYIRIKVGK